MSKNKVLEDDSLIIKTEQSLARSKSKEEATKMGGGIFVMFSLGALVAAVFIPTYRLYVLSGYSIVSGLIAMMRGTSLGLAHKLISTVLEMHLEMLNKMRKMDR